MWLFIKAAGLLASALALVGCSPRADGPASKASVEQTNRQATLADWQAAVGTVRRRLDERTGADGVTSFEVCVEQGPGDCAQRLPGKYDAFKRVEWILDSQHRKQGMLVSTLPVYVALPECEEPSLFIAPFMVRKGSWLFMKRVQVLAGTELVMDAQLADVKREPTSGWVMEYAEHVLPPSEVERLAGALQADPVVIRFAGDGENLTLKPPQRDAFIASLREMLPVYKAAREAIRKLGPRECSPGRAANQSSGSSRPL